MALSRTLREWILAQIGLPHNAGAGQVHAPSVRIALLIALAPAPQVETSRVMSKLLADTQLTEVEMNAIRKEAIEFAGIGLYRYRFDGTVIFMDRTALRLFDLENRFPDPSEVAGKDISELLVYVRPRRLLRDMIRATGQVRALEYPFNTLNGEERWLRNDSYLTRDPQTGEEVIQATIRDITPVRRAQESIGRLNIVLRTLRDVNVLITREGSRDRLIKAVCDILVERGGYLHAWIALLEASARVAIAAEAGLGQHFSAMLALLNQGHLPQCGRQVLTESDAVVLRAPGSACRDCPLQRVNARQGRICVRLEYGGEVYGFLAAAVSSRLIPEEERSLMIEVGADIALALHNADLEAKRSRAQQELAESFEKLRGALEATVRAVAATAEKRDPYTAGHQERVARLACAIAEEMSLPQEQVQAVRVAAILHDIGKVSIPVDILNKPGPLNELEMRFIRTHPQTAYDIVQAIPLPWPVAAIVLQHHERMDGSGYPAGLSGDDILLEARILGVADSVEAMAAHRPFRPAMGLEVALREISRHKGVLYDPRVVKACLRVFNRRGFQFDGPPRAEAPPGPAEGDP